MLQWEETSCNWCGETEGDLVLEGPDRLTGLPGRFKLIRCGNCGLNRQNPRLEWESLEQYYPEDYRAYEPIIETEGSLLRQMDRRYGMRKRLRAIERLQKEGRLLDVGCGTGIFLSEAERSGRWELMGVEPNLDAVRYASQHLDCSILQARFSEAELLNEGFDVVTMWNVLEHMESPIDDLRRAHSVLREEGWIVFSIPNLESWEANIFQRYWLGWDLPRHLYLFPGRVLGRILTEIGFRNMSMRCVASSHAALGISLEFWLKAQESVRPSRRERLLRIYHSMPFRLAMALPLWTLDQFRVCPIITVFAQRHSK